MCHDIQTQNRSRHELNCPPGPSAQFRRRAVAGRLATASSRDYTDPHTHTRTPLALLNPVSATAVFQAVGSLLTSFFALRQSGRRPLFTCFLHQCRNSGQRAMFALEQVFSPGLGQRWQEIAADGALKKKISKNCKGRGSATQSERTDEKYGSECR